MVPWYWIVVRDESIGISAWRISRRAYGGDWRLEIVEVREIFERFGLATDNSARIAQALSERPDAWVDFMMRFELGLEEPDPKLAVTSAVTIAGAYIPGGLSPLSPYMLEQTARASSRDAVHAFPEAKRADAAYRATSSTQIAPHNIDQLLSGLRLFWFGMQCRINDVEANVILEDLGHKSIQRSTACRELLQHLAAVTVRFEERLDAVDLPADPADAVQQFGLFANCMCHKPPRRDTCTGHH